MKIRCHTRFDITATAVRGHFRAGQLPFQDATQRIINSIESWTKARNQQRNWDTINQIMSLRCLPENITVPRRQQHDQHTVWSFWFEVPDPATIALGDDAVGWLHTDCEGVPMITGLDEDPGQATALATGLNGNINFTVVDDK